MTGGDLFAGKGFIHGSPAGYVSKQDQQQQQHLVGVGGGVSPPPIPVPVSNHFGLPPCITVTSQSGVPGDGGGALPPLGSNPGAGDGHALSPASISPGGGGGDFSSPSLVGGGGGSGRPQPARSPFEWMKKPSYQNQPEKNGMISKFQFQRKEDKFIAQLRR